MGGVPDDPAPTIVRCERSRASVPAGTDLALIAHRIERKCAHGRNSERHRIAVTVINDTGSPTPCFWAASKDFLGRHNGPDAVRCPPAAHASGERIDILPNPDPGQSPRRKTSPTPFGMGLAAEDAWPVWAAAKGLLMTLATTASREDLR